MSVEEVQTGATGAKVQTGAAEEDETGVTGDVLKRSNRGLSGWSRRGGSDGSSRGGGGANKSRTAGTRAEMVNDDQSQAAGVQLGDQPVGMQTVGQEEEEVMEYSSDSNCASVADSESLSGDLYTLEDINNFLDENFGQSVKVIDYFSDQEFLKSALGRLLESTSQIKGNFYV